MFRTIFTFMVLVIVVSSLSFAGNNKTKFLPEKKSYLETSELLRENIFASIPISILKTRKYILYDYGVLSVEVFIFLTRFHSVIGISRHHSLAVVRV